MPEEEAESECHAQCDCEDFIPSKSGKTCIFYNGETGECYAPVDEADDFNGNEEFEDEIEYV